MSDYQLIEQIFAQLLFLLKDVFDDLEVDEVKDFIDVGEYGIALDTLVGIIDEESKIVSQEAIDLVKKIAIAMSLDFYFIEKKLINTEGFESSISDKKFIGSIKMENNEISSEVIDCLLQIITSTKNRDSEQGVKVFNVFIEKLRLGKEAGSLLTELIRHLSGIEAHGHFTDEEYKSVNRIKELEKITVK